MSVLFNRIKSDNIALRKEKSIFATESSYILSKINDAIKSTTENGFTPPVKDSLIYQVIRSYIKQMNQLLDAGKDNLTEDQKKTTNDNIEFSKQYLPEELDPTKVSKDVDDIMTTIENPSKKSMGIIIKSLKEKYGDSFDGSIVTPIVNQKLS